MWTRSGKTNKFKWSKAGDLTFSQKKYLEKKYWCLSTWSRTKGLTGNFILSITTPNTEGWVLVLCWLLQKYWLELWVWRSKSCKSCVKSQKNLALDFWLLYFYFSFLQNILLFSLNTLQTSQMASLCWLFFWRQSKILEYFSTVIENPAVEQEC